MIRLTVPSIEEDDLQAVREVLISGYLVQGPRVEAFEQAVAKYVGTKYAVAVSNCTAALHLSLLALGIKPGDLVIVPAYSFIATANVIELCGAQPLFVDIQPNTFNMDPNLLEVILKRLMSRKQTGKRVKAVLPVHTFGQLADMPTIIKIASRYELPVVEDAACALGATLEEHQAGTWGIMGCFSFHPRKAITTGEGGIITTNDADLAGILRALRNHGLDPDALPPDSIMPGFNYRMTEFQAALGLTQMIKLDRIIAARRRLAGHYDELLRDNLVDVPAPSRSAGPVYQSYVVLLRERLSRYRDEIIALLKKLDIETNIGTWHMPMTKYFTNRYGYKPGDFPAADKLFARSLALPIYETLLPEQQKFVVDTLYHTLDEMD
jgi:dTDP-4-amino-4,6-dideoxygalactose transaminase